jgi:3-oxoadipate enol-lactonase
MVTKLAVTTGFADVNEARLYFETAGDGERSIVFIHAGIADHRLWNNQIPAFARDYLTVRYDMRGYGQSSLQKGPFSHTRDLASLLLVLGIRSAVLVGCSMGGLVALDFALAYPRMVEGLVMVCSGPSGLDDAEAEQANPPQWDETGAAFRAGDLERTSELETQIWVDGEQRTPDQVDPAVRALVYEMNLTALRNEVAARDASNAFLIPAAHEQLEKITAPTLIIAGALDRPYTLVAADAMAARIPNAQKVVIQDTAHVPSLERPAEFNQALGDWLATLP